VQGQIYRSGGVSGKARVALAKCQVIRIASGWVVDWQLILKRLAMILRF
jgi:hypothetical protein